MDLLRLNVIFRLFGTLVIGGFLPSPAWSGGIIEITEVEKFSGTATDITIQREPGGHGQVEFRIQGRFDTCDVDLSNSFLVIDSMFEEAGVGGAGELITARDDEPIFPGFIVEARTNSKPHRAIYESPRQFRPHMRLMVQKRRGLCEFRFKLDRGLARTGPNLCIDVPDSRRQMTDMTHSFTIASIDGSDPDIVVTTTQPWECMKPKDFNMRSRPKKQNRDRSGGDSGDNKPPQATLRAIVDHSSIPCCSVMLDGSRSQDRNGPITAYIFDLTNRETGQRITGFPLTQTNPQVGVTLAPGEYEATLDVLGDQGEVARKLAIKRLTVRD